MISLAVQHQRLDPEKYPSLGKGKAAIPQKKCPSLSGHLTGRSTQHNNTKGGLGGRGVFRGERRECELVEIQSPIDPEKLKDKLSQVASKVVRQDTVQSILLFLNFFSRNRRNGQCEISNALAEQYLSRFTLKDEKKVRLMPLLVRLGIVEKTRNHSTTARYSCRYKLALSPVETHWVEISGNALKKMRGAPVRKARRALKYPERDWIERTLEASDLGEEILTRLAHKRGKDGKSRPYRKVSEQIRNRQWNLSAKHGRFHSVYSQIPPVDRQEIRIHGEQVTRLDLSASHLHMLCPYNEELIGKSNNKENKAARLDELKRYRDDYLSSGDAYAKLLPDEWDRCKAKKAFNTFLNKRGNRFPHEVLDAMKANLPYMARTIADRRNPIGPVLQVYERNLILEVVGRLREKGIPVIPVTDEILVPHSRRQEALQIFMDETQKVSGVSPKISGIRNRPNLQKQPQVKVPNGYCPKCWGESIAAPIDGLTCPHGPRLWSYKQDLNHSDYHEPEILDYDEWEEARCRSISPLSRPSFQG
jgi:hypothetical protein